MLKLFVSLYLLFNIVTPIKTYQILEKNFLLVHQPSLAGSYLYKTNSVIKQFTPAINSSTTTNSSKSANNLSITNFLLSNNSAQISNIYKYNLALVMATFFLFGIFIAFTPCVFPMLPILLTIISRNSTTAYKSFILALSYVLGNAISYAIAGVLAAQFGSTLQNIFQNVIINILIIILFVIFSLSLFGLFAIRLPNTLNSKLNSTINSNINTHHESNCLSIISAFIAGALSALILSPCVTAPLAGALLYISYTGNLLIGGGSLFMLGLGSGLPLLCIAVFGNKFLPKSGRWMEMIKYCFGYLMLLMAIYIASRILNNTWINLILSIFLIVFITHIAATGFKIFKTKIHTSIKLFLIITYALTISFCVIYLLIKEYKSLPELSSHPIIQNRHDNTNQQQPELKFQVVKNMHELDKILNTARNNTPVILDFSAQWCLACKEMDMATLRDHRIIEMLNPYTKVRVDLTDNNNETKTLQKKYGVFAPPSLVFINQNGGIIHNATITGYISADKLYEILNKIQIIPTPTTQKPFNFKVGDLLFQDLNCGALCDGIGQVTYGVGNTYISHVGMIVRLDSNHNSKNNNPIVIEATGVGVVETTLSGFLNRSQDKNSHPMVIVGRLKPQYQQLIPQAINYAKQQLGKPYNASFSPHGNSGNKSFYCSELIYDAFTYANHNNPIFGLNIMSFNDPATRHITKYWETYFAQINSIPPEGQLGTNPGMMSRESNIVIVYQYGILRVHK